MTRVLICGGDRAGWAPAGHVAQGKVCALSGIERDLNDSAAVATLPRELVPTESITSQHTDFVEMIHYL